MHVLPHWNFKLRFGVWVRRTDANDDPELKVHTFVMTVREVCMRIR